MLSSAGFKAVDTQADIRKTYYVFQRGTAAERTLHYFNISHNRYLFTAESTEQCVCDQFSAAEGAEFHFHGRSRIF